MTSGDWQKIDCGTQRWWIDPQWSDQLLDGDGLRLEQWSQEGKVEIIKHSVHRTVYRVGLKDKPVYIKHYPVNDLRARARQWLRRAKAWIEWQRTTILQERHVPTIKPIAVGQNAERGSFIITEEIPNALSLLDYVELHWEQWKQAGNLTACHLLLKELGVFLAQMLHAGVVHDDLHAGNVLIHIEPDGLRQWFLIDPYNVQRQVRHDRAALLKTLSLISQTYWHRLTIQERLRCWRCFRQASGVSFAKADERHFFALLEKMVQRQTYANWNQRARRNTKANRDFYALRVRRCRAWASRDIPADWLAQFLYDPDAVVEQPTTRLVKKSRHGSVTVIEGPRQPVLLKKFLPRHWADRLIGRWRRSPALHCYRMAYRLQTALVPTAKPLAVVDHHHRGQLRSSYVITEYLANTCDLGEYWATASRHDQQQALNNLAAITQQLHTFRLSHRDLKAANILVRSNGMGETAKWEGEAPAELLSRKHPELLLVDLRGVTHSRWLTRTRKVKDLARLALSAITTLRVTRTDLLRFLKRYLPISEQLHWRSWWKDITHRMKQKINQNASRRRDLS